TDSEEVRRSFEPKAPTLERRWEAARQLKEAGLPVGICVTPMLPLTDPNSFVRRLAAFAPDVLVTQDFHDSGGAFGADTGPAARALLEKRPLATDEYEGFLRDLRARRPVFEAEQGFFPPPST